MNSRMGDPEALVRELSRARRVVGTVVGCSGVFVPSFSKYLLSAYHVPGPLLGTGDTVVIEVCKVQAVVLWTFQCSGWGG